jgi:hypothetical protein
MASDCIKLGAPSWFAAISNGGGSGAGSESLCLENLVIMKIKVVI